MIELEKRWRLKNLPNDCIISEVFITQYYIAEHNHCRIRVRKSVTLDETWYNHCVKYYIGEGAREEIENYLTVNQFERIISLYPEAEKEEKKRIIVDLKNGMTAEIDYYQNGDVVVEVEFYNMSQMENFIAPEWFGEEIRDRSFSAQKRLW